MEQQMNNLKIIWVYLITLAIVDMVIPVPIIGLILMYVLLRKPSWFKKSVLEIYSAKAL
jgi:hypothetical protein